MFGGVSVSVVLLVHHNGPVVQPNDRFVRSRRDLVHATTAAASGDRALASSVMHRRREAAAA
jgi:hypothetical protein